VERSAISRGNWGEEAIEFGGRGIVEPGCRAATGVGEGHRDGAAVAVDRCPFDESALLSAIDQAAAASW